MYARHDCSYLRGRLTEAQIVARAEFEERKRQMTMRWFGRRWPSTLCEDCPQIETPVGAACYHCSEPIQKGDTGIAYANGPVAHKNCFLRGIIGSVAHQQRRCSCFVSGSTEGDPSGMTPRQAADAAVKEWEKRSGR
jgi:hypothetical protein